MRNVDIRVRAGTAYAEAIQSIARLAWPQSGPVDINGIESCAVPIELLIGLDEDLRECCQNFASLMGHEVEVQWGGQVVLKPREPKPFDEETFNDVKSFAAGLMAVSGDSDES